VTAGLNVHRGRSPIGR